jgi:hypothetical protein
MQIQRLRIIVNTEHIWFNTVKNYCLSNEHTKAAEYWFENAKKIWLDRMNYRLEYNKVKTLNFNKLFTTEFVNDLVSQAWEHNTSILAENHKKWLVENNQFSFERTIDVIATKLKTMNWNQSEGWIEYNPN